ncbi:hypothetical protein ACP275_02G051100 [Erythranthe tilingii]
MENYSFNSYPESGDSSPRSREIDFENPTPWEDSQPPPPNYRVKFMCSYGGKIHPRPHDNQLSYIGGETKILAVDRGVRFGSLLSKLIAMCDNENISFKYQLPGEDLDALISVTNDDDLEHMMHEYERLYRASPKPARLRIFIFPNLNQSLNSSARSFGSDDAKSEKERFVEALNSAPIMTPPPQTAASVAVAPPPQLPAGNADFLFGLEKAHGVAAQPPLQVEDPVIVAGSDERFMGLDPIQKHIQDLQRLRIEEQQAIYQRKSDDNLAGRGFAGGEYYNKPQERVSPVTVQGGVGVPYWSDKQVQAGGVYSPNTTTNTVNNEQQPVYMIQAPAGAYHPQMVRPMAGAPTQGYYTVQRVPSDIYRDQQQQQQMYNMMQQQGMPSMAVAPPQTMPPQKAAGYSDGFGMIRPATTGGLGMMTEPTYAQVVYDGGMGRQVVYAAPPGGVMGGAPPAQYQAMAGDMRPVGALNPEAGGKGVGKVTQASV